MKLNKFLAVNTGRNGVVGWTHFGGVSERARAGDIWLRMTRVGNFPELDIPSTDTSLIRTLHEISEIIEIYNKYGTLSHPEINLPS
jgi:hypothetical protein